MQLQQQQERHLTMSKLQAQELQFQLQMIQCTANAPQRQQTPDYGQSFKEDEGQTNQIGTQSDQLVETSSDSSIIAQNLQALSAPLKPSHVKNRSSILHQSRSLVNFQVTIPNSSRKSFSPTCKKTISPSQAPTCNGDTVFAIDLSGIPRRRDRKLRIDDRQAWIQQIASTTRDSIMQKQSEKIVTQQNMIKQLQLQIDNLMMKMQKNQSETAKGICHEDNNLKIHQNDDTLPQDFLQEEELPQTIENLHQDRFDAILQSPPSNGYLEKSGMAPFEKKSSIQTPNSRYLDQRHFETEDRIWALRSQKLNQELEIARLATLTPLQMLQENTQRRQTERFSRCGGARLLTEPDDCDKSSKRKSLTPLSPQSVTRFSIRPTPAKGSRNANKLRSSKSQIHRQLEKNNETLMAEKQKEIMKANGFSFQPTINPVQQNTRNLYQVTRAGSQSTNLLIPATGRDREELVQWNQQIRDRKSQQRELSRKSQTQAQLEAIQKSSRMCPGTIKILHAQGAIEKQKDELGQVVVVGSPEKAGARLYQQAMQSMMNKHNKRMEVYLQRELLTEPPIAYPNRVTKTQKLISPKQQALYNETFESFRAVAEAASKEMPQAKQRVPQLVQQESLRTGTFQGSFGFNPVQGSYSTRNLNQQSKQYYTQNSFSRQSQATHNTRNSINFQKERPVEQKRDADLMRAKLNMYIRDKYSNQSVFSTIKPAGSHGSISGESRRESDIGMSHMGSTSGKQISKQHENNMTDVAMLDKLTPCMKTLQSGAINSGIHSSHFSPSEGNKTTIKKSHRTSVGRDFEILPSNTKVSFDFSNLEMPKQEALLSDDPVSPLMNLRKTSLNSQQQQDQPLFFSQHTSRSANQQVTSTLAIQQLEQLRFRIPPQSQATSSSSDSFNPGLIANKMSDHQVDPNNSLVMTAVSQTSLPQNPR